MVHLRAWGSQKTLMTISGMAAWMSYGSYRGQGAIAIGNQNVVMIEIENVAVFHVETVSLILEQQPFLEQLCVLANHRYLVVIQAWPGPQMHLVEYRTARCISKRILADSITSNICNKYFTVNQKHPTDQQVNAPSKNHCRYSTHRRINEKTIILSRLVRLAAFIYR